MNKLELEALNTNLSNDARALYCIGLRPHANTTTGFTAPLNYRALLKLLNAKELKFTKGRKLNYLLEELANANLIKLSEDQDIKFSLDGSQIVLPLVTQEKISTLQPKYQINRDWKPDSIILKDICNLVGIIDPDFTQQELGEFVAYWIGRNESNFNQYQWNHKFAQYLKRTRTVQLPTNLKQIGTQIEPNPISRLEADDNAKRLVAKYKKTKNNV